MRYARPRKSGGFTKMPHCSLSHAILIGDLADVASCPARAVEEIQPPAPKPSQAGQLMKFNPPEVNFSAGSRAGLFLAAGTPCKSRNKRPIVDPSGSIRGGHHAAPVYRA
jgi:hypothetical protein